MGLIRDLQAEHEHWVRHNFPDQQPHDGLLGMMEELGELAHAHLKHQQQIRTLGDREAYKEAAADAIGDVFVYMMSYCNTNFFDLENIIQDTWNGVKQRDWQLHPDKGVA